MKKSSYVTSPLSFTELSGVIHKFIVLSFDLSVHFIDVSKVDTEHIPKEMYIYHVCLIYYSRSYQI